MSEEEKTAIRKQHEEATKAFNQKRANEKAGVQFKVPEKPKEEPKKEEPKKEKPKK